MKNVINVRHIYKYFGNQEILHDINFEIKQNEIFMLLGPNGAGKSTFLNILSGALKPDSGAIDYSFENQNKNFNIKKNIGMVFQNGLLDDSLTVKENLLLRGGFYHNNKFQLNKAYTEVIELTSIKNIINKKYGCLSGGQKRKCDIARALIGCPRLLIMDEPTASLDKSACDELYKTIFELKKNKAVTIIISTHNYNEIKYADNIAIIENGRNISTNIAFNNIGASLIIYTINSDVLEKCLIKNNIHYLKLSDKFLIALDNPFTALSYINKLRSYITTFEITDYLNR